MKTIKQKIDSNKKPFPKSTILCGIEYNIQEHENLISFRQSCPMWGIHNQISFHRVDNGYGCWYIEIKSTFDIMASHITSAFKVVQQYRGDD